MTPDTTPQEFDPQAWLMQRRQLVVDSVRAAAARDKVNLRLGLNAIEAHDKATLQRLADAQAQRMLDAGAILLVQDEQARLQRELADAQTKIGDMAAIMNGTFGSGWEDFDAAALRVANRKAVELEERNAFLSGHMREAQQIAQDAQTRIAGLEALLVDAQAEVDRLKEHQRRMMHDPDACNGVFRGDPPRYTPQCIALQAEVERLRAIIADAFPMCEEDWSHYPSNAAGKEVLKRMRAELKD
jgi:hypothetical protein